MSEQTNSNAKKAGVAALVVGGMIAAGGFGAGLHALFTDSQDAGQANIDSGTVKLGDFKSGVASAEYTDAVKNIAAGDTTYRFFSVKNTGSLELGKVEAQITTDGALASTGAQPTASPTQVNGDTSVGNKNTPLVMKITACVNGSWSVDNTAKNADGSVKPVPKCSSNVMTDIVTGAEKPDAGDTTAIPGTTPATSLVKKNVVLFDNTAQVDDKGVNSPNVIDTQNLKPGAASQVNYMITYHLPSTAKNEYQNTGATVNMTVTGTQRDSQVTEAN